MADEIGDDMMAAEPREESSRLGVVIVDPLPVVLRGLALLLEERLEVVGEASSGEAALQVIKALPRRHDVIALVGLQLQGETDAFALIRAIRESFPVMTVVACGANPDTMSISRALFVGADGFVDKGSDPETFVTVLTRCARGDIVVEDRRGVIAEIAAGVANQREVDTVLTDREREVLTIAAQGLTAKKIGERLDRSDRTVTTHLARIYRKLGVTTRVGAVNAAIRAGLVEVPARE